MPSSYIGGMDVLQPAFCRTRTLTMTSNAEEQANSPAAAESDQTRPRSATQAPCRARQAKVGKESHGLVGAFCPWFPERNCCQVHGSRSRVRQQRGQGAPLLSQRLNFHDAYPNSAAGDFTSPAFSSSVSFRDELQIHSDLSSPGRRAILGVAERGANICVRPATTACRSVPRIASGLIWSG